MNLNFIFLLVYVALLFVLLKVKPSLLFLIFPIVAFIFRTTRTMIGPAPLYWYDVTFGFVLSVFPYSTYFKKWFKRIPNWHLNLILISFIFGAISPIVYFGFAPQIIYIFLHKSICWFAFPVGIFLFHPDNPPEWGKNLKRGLIFVGVAYCIWAALEEGSPGRCLLFNNFFFKDMGEDLKATRDALGDYYAGRPNGPFMTGTAFGGSCLMMVYSLWFLSKNAPKGKKLIYNIATLLTLLGMLFTVSRLDVVAVSMSYFFYVLLEKSKSRFYYIGLGFLGVLTILMLSDTYVISTIEERFLRWQNGALEDESFRARAIDGPVHLFGLLNEHPSLYLTGAGMEVEKLAKTNVSVQGFDAGFLSNGFLLFLFYTGIIGFTVYLSFWIWMAYKALTGLKIFRAQHFAIIVGVTFCIFSDNYGAVDETIILEIFLLCGMLIGSNFFEKIKQKRLKDAAAYEGA